MTGVRVVVQARMSSQRFPGKVLAPFRGEPIVLHVVRAARAGCDEVIVATSTEPSDDPLAAYLDAAGIACFRGPLDDVLERFKRCAHAHPSEWVIRVSADSPLLDSQVVRDVAAAASDDVDVASTVLGAGVPHGMNAELIRTAALLGIDPVETTEHDREHVTPFFYRHPGRYRLVGVDPHVTWEDGASFTVDTVEDLARLEASA